MGTPVYTRGAFVIKDADLMKACDAARKAVAEGWHKTHTPFEPWVTWSSIYPQLASLFFRCGLTLVECTDLLVKGVFVGYSAMNLNSWASLILNAIEPYLEEGTGIFYYAPEDDLNWGKIVIDGVITPVMTDPKDGEQRPCCPLLW